MSKIAFGAGSGNSTFNKVASTAQTSLGKTLSSGVNSIATTSTPGGVDSNATNRSKANDRASQNGVRRTAWIMTTTEWTSADPKKLLIWGANPSEVSWSMAQRATHVKNLYGTVMHVWPDNFRNTFYDEFKLTLSLQSGSILPILLDGNPNFDTAPGLDNFYEFMQLVDAPKLTSKGRVNEVIITYNSNLFPKLTLYGMFDPQGIRFTDSTSNPNMVNSWSADFIVYRTDPVLSSNKSIGKGGSQIANPDLLARWLEERVKNVPTGRPQTLPATGGMSEIGGLSGLGGAASGIGGIGGGIPNLGGFGGIA